MSCQHFEIVIPDDALRTWLRDEQWHLFASCTRRHKRLDALVGGSAFRVMVDDKVTYRGDNSSDAVRAYNEVV